MMAPRTARAEFSCVKQYCKLFAIVLVSAVLAGCGNSHVCASGALNVSPQNAVADHSAPTPANSQLFLAFGAGLPVGCVATQSNLINVVWSVSDPIDVSISNMQGNTSAPPVASTRRQFQLLLPPPYQPARITISRFQERQH